MKHTIKLLAFLFIIATALFIVACGPVEEPDPVATVDKGKGTANIPKGTTLSDPGAPTEPALPQGLYKGTPTLEFLGWFNGDDKFEAWGQPQDTDITLIAKWSDPPTAEPLPGTDDIVSEAIKVVNDSTVTTDKFTLLLKEKVTATKAVNLRKGELSITSTDGFQKTIKGFKVDSGYAVYLTVGEITTASTYDKTLTPKLTLEHIRLEGVEAGDSLIRVSAKATLTLNSDLMITGHKNSSWNGSGATGNGSAVCIVDEATFNMNSGSIIEDNESTEEHKSSATASTGTGNRNRVGGVYTFGKVILNINGGEITGNKATKIPGNTADLYATEGCTFNLSGKVKIGELTINADVPGAEETNSSNASSTVPATITVSNLENDVGKLSLRTTGTLAVAKTVWEGKPILYGLDASVL